MRLCCRPPSSSAARWAGCFRPVALPIARCHRLFWLRQALKRHPRLVLEQERQAIDAELLEVFSDAELRHGIRVSDDLLLKQRSRTAWDYAPEIRDVIKELQKQARRDGRAQPHFTHYLVFA
jgi:hypothetical protein